jgi:hypothetical protein|tara:strand:- start:15586 stop:16335 length:750 start_codon:yes stop_codon:yes gene_type:complete
MNLVIYTALFADPDLPLEEVGRFFPFTHDKGDVKYVAFTNRKDLKSDFWQVIVMDKPDAMSWRMMSRYLKWNPSKIKLPKHTHSLWMDSQCYFKYEPKAIIEHYLKDGMHTAIHHHTDLRSVYVEGMVTSYAYMNDKPSIVNKQLERYHEEGMPYQYDHFETGILIRKNCKESIEFSEQVYKELETDSIRDQISTPYVVWKRRENGDKGILTITESFTAHQGQLPFNKSQIFFTEPKPSEKLKEDLTKR